jgi:hypothetical protein
MLTNVDGTITKGEAGRATEYPKLPSALYKRKCLRQESNLRHQV